MHIETQLSPQNIGQISNARHDALRLDPTGGVWHNGRPLPSKLSRLVRVDGELYGKGLTSGIWYKWNDGSWQGSVPAEVLTVLAQ